MKRYIALSLLFACPGVQAQTSLGISFRGDLAAGYDSNLYLETSALARDVDQAGGAGLELITSTVLRVGQARSHHMLLTYNAGFHQYFLSGGDHESMLQHGAALAYTTAALAGFRFSASAGFDHLVLAQEDDAGWIAFQGRLDADRVLCTWARASLAYRVEYTGFGALSSIARQLGHGPELSLALRVAPGLVLEPFYALTVEAGDSEDMEAFQHQAGLWISWRAPWFPLWICVGYQLAVIALTMHTQEVNGAGKEAPMELAGRDVLHAVGEEIRFEALSWLEVFVRHESVLGTSDIQQDYTRHQVFAGIQIPLGWSRELPIRPTSPRSSMEVEYRDPNARAVAVVGSFNGWNPDAGHLHRQGNVWHGTVTIPPGRQTYMLWVDGRTVAPPGCKTWIQDGFGGKSCVVESY